MKPIRYLEGDATRPQGEGPKIIAHVCNDIGAWGKGFVLAISKRSKKPEVEFKKWYSERENNDYALGAVQLIEIEPHLWVANMIGQHKIAKKGDTGLPPVRYQAIEQALSKLAEKAIQCDATVHMPRIGCGLAGGQWDLIEPLIIKQLSERDIEVNVYDWK
jgi:O-acetyl-ADP-ribose deacetylase (regulator of RNase III)